jgi:signal transduction histidine kinase
MKLRVQQLERTWKDKPEEFNGRIHAFSESMIEQIDALARIANEFSHFAKMPKPNLNPEQLDTIIHSVLELFNHVHEVNITYRKQLAHPALVYIDKDQIIRVLNNLLNNAIQAIPDGRQGKIDICLRVSEKVVLVRIQDNGVGISNENKQRIFVPNFTTKSTGTGLGLAMVKTIVEQNNGRVFFRSKHEKGASFYLSLPRQT